MKYSEWFRKAAKGKVHDRSWGLCYNFCVQFGKELHMCMSDYHIDFRNWDEYSGDPWYPVPSNNRILPRYVYYKALFMYAPITKYGRSRRRLALWLAKEFERFNL